MSVTLVSKSALNGIDAPVVLLAFQTTVQVVLLTIVGMMMGWVKLWRPISVTQSPFPLMKSARWLAHGPIRAITGNH
jgi:GDP-fucose transporter C1